MDGSQSSNIFSDTSLVFCDSATEIKMDTLSYSTLLSRTKTSLCDLAQIGKVSFPVHFSGLLEDCRLCITQTLDTLANILLSSDIQLVELTQCMEDAASLLQLLSTLIKNAIKSTQLSCSLYETFPTTTGHIITFVFIHCKNSESIYGNHLNDVQIQLKDLFRSCHELQLTYLMVLEKHFVFDLTKAEQLDVLVEALAINLKIGEVAQSLDVKTMAEQWKAYMAICEKYSSTLMEKLTHQECTQLLCAMIKNNLSVAAEENQDEKIIMRSLKITNFTIKVLMKMCVIFKKAPMKDYLHIVDMLIYAYLHNPAYLELIAGKQSHVANAMFVNVCKPSDFVLEELVMDDRFVNVVFEYDIDEIKDEKQLGYLFLLVAIIKSTLQKKGATPTYRKNELLSCVIKLLRECHIWLNIGMKFENEMYKSNRSVGLFEYILIHAVGLATCMNGTEMYHLENNLFKYIVGTESISALFSSNLLSTLARISNNNQLLYRQVVFMSQTYLKLETIKNYSYSPQKLHIAHTIEDLFMLMSRDDKVRLLQQFDPMDRRNSALWTALKIRNLPKDLQKDVEEEVMKRYKSHSHRQNKDTIKELIEDIKLLSTCSFPSNNAEDCLLQAWMRVCPQRNPPFLTKVLHTGMLWYFEYIEAVVAWTDAVMPAFCHNSVNLVKVLHVIANIIKICNTELNMLLIDVLVKLASVPVKENQDSVIKFVRESITALVETSSNATVRNRLFKKVNYCNNEHLNKIMSSSVKEEWNRYRRHARSDDYNVLDLKESLLGTRDLEYVHKCIDGTLESNNQIPTTGSSNFDFADLDTLFDNECDAEPSSKKLKTSGRETETILDRLEADTSLLCDLKENFTSEHKKRIKCMCERLLNLVP